jgi:signal transduction histidine kinase
MEISTNELTIFEALSGVPVEQLEWLIEHSEIREFNDGEFLSVLGKKIDGPHFILDGQISLCMRQGNEQREISTITKGAIFGYLPYSRATVATLNARAHGPVRVLSFHTELIREMVRDQFELTQALVHTMSNRVKDFTAMQQQNDKMSALGKLAAGLAHELNNPAAALVSDSLSLRQHLRQEPLAFKDLTALHLESSQVDGTNTELLKILSNYNQTSLTLRERSKKEDLIADWLSTNNIDTQDEMPEILADFNVDIENLEVFKRFIPNHARNAVFNWILNILVTEKMVLDIMVSSSRIAELVKSVKIFTHLDRGSDKVAMNIHDGIRNTIRILGHKFRSGNIKLIEDYDETLPAIKAFPGELNQVWINLIDNALDSMELNKAGTLTIKTFEDRGFVKVNINDDGQGIPAEIMTSIFDPFFTTKELGKGTGMGLETIRRIVYKLKGEVKVSSIPGNTTFTVCLPLVGQAVEEENIA